MKVYASSEQSAAPPFLHLGYLAAAQFTMGYGWALPMVLVLAGMLLGYKSSRRAPLGGRYKQTVFKRRKGVAGISGAVMLGLGLVLLPFSALLGRTYDRSWSHVRSYLDHAFSEAVEYGQVLPQSPGTIPLRDVYPEEGQGLVNDPWGNAMNLRIHGGKDSPTYQVISAGPDGEMETEDDIATERLRPGDRAGRMR